MPEDPSTRVGSFSTLLMFCHLTEFLTPPALASYHIATEKFGPGQRGATSAQEHRLRSASYSAHGAGSVRTTAIVDRSMSVPINVRFTPESRHWNSVAQCPLCAKSGHRNFYSITSSAR